MKFGLIQAFIYNYDYNGSAMNYVTLDILCELPPPNIPTHTEYTLATDDGTVLINSLEYPALIRTSGLELNSTFNSSDIPQNYMANLT